MSEAPTQADIDKAIKAALADAKAEWEAETEGLKNKNRELIGKLRDAQGVKPEDLAAAEARADKAEADLAAANKQITTLTKERDTATKALETEQGAGRSRALEGEINAGLAEGGILPVHAKTLASYFREQAKVDVGEGGYAVMIGDKPARDAIKAFLDTEDGKHYRAAPINGGGGAPGGGGKGDAKTVTRAVFDGMSHVERSEFSKDGGKVVDQAA